MTHTEDGHVSRAPPAQVDCDLDSCRHSHPHAWGPCDLPPWQCRAEGRVAGGDGGPRPGPLPGETVQSLDEVIRPRAVFLGALH